MRSEAPGVSLLSVIFLPLMIPLLILNFAGGIAGGIWLLVLGRWADLGFGLAILVGGSLLISLLLLPSIIFVGPAIGLVERGRTVLASPLLFLGAAWTYVVMTVWCIGVFVFLLNRAGDAKIPYLLWAYANAQGPWTFLAQKDLQSDPHTHSVVTSLFAQLGCIAMIVSALLARAEPNALSLATWFLPFMAIAALYQVLAVMTAKRA